MTTARCPACGASVLDGAPWCTLCYTDLRAPAVAPASAVAAVPSPSTPLDAPAAAAVAAATPAALPAASLDLLDPRLDAPVSTVAGARRGPASWPCLTCGASVELEHDACPQCGTAFLAGANPVAELDIPLIGKFRPLEASKGSRAWLMVGGGLVVTVVLVVLLSLLGLFL